MYSTDLAKLPTPKWQTAWFKIEQTRFCIWESNRMQFYIHRLFAEYPFLQIVLWADKANCYVKQSKFHTID